MKLWLLRPIAGSNLWNPWYDKCFGFVVRAETEEQARAFAEQESGTESRDDVHAWINHDHSTCVELTSDGDAGVVVQDFASA